MLNLLALRPEIKLNHVLYIYTDLYPSALDEESLALEIFDRKQNEA